MTDEAIIIIPARMASTRLPGKPLADIAGKPMIVHVMDRANEAGVGQAYVACCEQQVHDVVCSAGGKAIMTDPSHPSGTDRVFEAVQKLQSEHEYILNIQGDLPTLDPKLIRTVLAILQQNPAADIATLASPVHTAEERINPNIVKPVLALPEGKKVGRALYFSRSCVPYGEGDVYHHIGLYAYRRAALETFVTLPQSLLEKRESLEQLRALEHGMRIEVGVVDTVPLGVDTPSDLDIARNVLK